MFAYSFQICYVEHAMKFVCFETLKPFVTHDPKKGIQVHERLIAGATAGAIAQSIVYPLETIKTRLATTPGAKMVLSLFRTKFRFVFEISVSVFRRFCNAQRYCIGKRVC